MHIAYVCTVKLAINNIYLYIIPSWFASILAYEAKRVPKDLKPSYYTY